MSSLCELDWQAIATAFTGLAAVGAAMWVGTRQSKILDRQVDIEEANLRLSSFDRRFKVFEAAEQFLREILQKADDPSPDTQRDFVLAMGEARFLYSSAVSNGLREIYAKWAEFHALKMIMDHSFRSHGHYGEGNPEKERQLLDWFFKQFESLPDLFAEIRPLKS